MPGAVAARLAEAVAGPDARPGVPDVAGAVAAGPAGAAAARAARFAAPDAVAGQPGAVAEPDARPVAPGAAAGQPGAAARRGGPAARPESSARPAEQASAALPQAWAAVVAHPPLAVAPFPERLVLLQAPGAAPPAFGWPAGAGAPVGGGLEAPGPGALGVTAAAGGGAV